MVKYGDLVDYIKRNHVNWNTDLFDVLRGFFEKLSQSQTESLDTIVKQEIIFPENLGYPEATGITWEPPANGEYTSDDLLNLLNQ